MWVAEGHTDEFLCGNLVEPVSEGPIRAAEALSIIPDGLLVVLAVVRRCGSRLVYKM